MKKTPEEMAEHIRDAICNANSVIEDAEKEGYSVQLSLIGESTLSVKRITLNIDL